MCVSQGSREYIESRLVWLDKRPLDGNGGGIQRADLGQSLTWGKTVMEMPLLGAPWSTSCGRSGIQLVCISTAFFLLLVKSLWLNPLSTLATTWPASLSSPGSSTNCRTQQGTYMTLFQPCSHIPYDNWHAPEYHPFRWHSPEKVMDSFVELAGTNKKT